METSTSMDIYDNSQRAEKKDARYGRNVSVLNRLPVKVEQN